VTRRVTHPARAMESSGFQTELTLASLDMGIGGVRHYPGADEIWPNAIYGDRAFSIQEGRVRVVVAAPVRIWAAYFSP
jgi:hypothetical protein